MLENCAWLSSTDNRAAWDYGVQLLLLHWVNKGGLDLEWAKGLDPAPKIERLKGMEVTASGRVEEN